MTPPTEFEVLSESALKMFEQPIKIELPLPKKPVIYNHNKREVSELMRAGNYEMALETTKENSKLRLFKGLEPRLNDDMFWRLLRHAWMWSYVTTHNRFKWVHLFNSNRPRRGLLMTPSEHKRFQSMPDELQIWRGCGHFLTARGIAWSLNEKEAMDYVDRSCRTHYNERAYKKWPVIPTLVSATVKKDKVLAYFDDSLSSDIVVDPRHVHVLSIKKVHLPPT